MKKFCSLLKRLGIEIKARFKSTSPYLFRIIQRLAIVIGFFSGLFLALKITGVAIPEPFNTWGDYTVLINAGIAFIVAKLPVDTDKASPETLRKIKDNEPK